MLKRRLEFSFPVRFHIPVFNYFQVFHTKYSRVLGFRVSWREMPRTNVDQPGQPSGSRTPNPAANRHYRPATHYSYSPYPQSSQPTTGPISVTQLSETIVQRMTPGLNSAFATLHRNNITHANNIQNSLKALSKSISGAREDAHKESSQVASVVEASYTVQKKAIQKVMDRVDRVEKYVRTGDESLNDRLSSIECAIAGLIERDQDPSAPCE
jgi:hypothetical protein